MRPSAISIVAISAVGSFLSEDALAKSVPLEFNAIGYYVNRRAGYVCEGEHWTLYAVGGKPTIVWTPDSDSYYVEFSYAYDGRILRLFNGRKLYTDPNRLEERVRDRSFAFAKGKAGRWVMNGRTLEECRG